MSKRKKRETNRNFQLQENALPRHASDSFTFMNCLYGRIDISKVLNLK